MSKINLFSIIMLIGFLGCCDDKHLATAFPQSNPNLEYELLSGGSQVGPNMRPRPTFMPITRKPLIINTPPPVDPNSKTFAYDAKSKTWTLVKKTNPTPAEGTLLWNQGNDKWLTNTPRT